MIFQASCFILYSIFSTSVVFLYEIFFNDVTLFLTDLNENYTAYVKLEIKDIFVHENFLIFRIFIEKITICYENHVFSEVTLHLSPLSPLGRPLW